MADQPTEDRVWRSLGSDEEVICPDCDESAFRFVPLGENTSIDTIGSVKICATEYGTYLHGGR